MRKSNVARRTGYLTTADVAQMLERTDRGARWIVAQHQLACEWTRRGQRLFREEEVQRLVRLRAAARMRHVRALRPKKFSVPGEPHQMSLFGARLHVGPWGRRSLPDPEVLRPIFGRKTGASDNANNVNLKAAKGRGLR